MNKIKSLSVLYRGRKVGTLALYQNRLAAFEYTSEWLAEGFSINPKNAAVILEPDVLTG